MTKTTTAAALFTFAIAATTPAKAMAPWTPPPMPTQQVVGGTLTFQDTLGFRPIRHHLVTIEHNGAPLATATTASDGTFEIPFAIGTLPVGSVVRIEFEAENYAANVFLDTDWQNDRITWSREIAVVDPAAAIDLSYAVGSAMAQDQFSAHFNILDTILWGRAYADARRSGSDDITQVDVQHPDTDWAHYKADIWPVLIATITLPGPSYTTPGGDTYGGSQHNLAFFDRTILHEYGHHLEWDISDVDLSIPNLLDSDHDICDGKGTTFGWSEGFPTFYALAVRAHYEGLSSDAKLALGYAGNLENYDFNGENDPCWSSATAPYDSELVVWKTLWDVIDPAWEPHDRINGAVSWDGKPMDQIVFEIFDDELEQLKWVPPQLGLSDPPTDIKAFHDAFVARGVYPGSHADIDRILYAHGICPHPLMQDYSPIWSECPNPLGDATFDGWGTVQSGFTAFTTSATPGSSYGGMINVDVNLQNTGLAYTDEGIRTRFFLGPHPVGELYVGSFLGTKNFKPTLWVPASVPEGTYPLTAVIDADDRLPELDEGNNSVQAWIFGSPGFVQVTVCGNGVCSGVESCSSCSADCGSCCGNGACESFEDCETCADDCGSCNGCGDGFCANGETTYDCPADCVTEEGPGEGTCFVAGTPIRLWDGTSKPIEQVVVGDVVLSYDTELGRLVPGEVRHTFVHPASDRLVAVNDGLVTTTMHRFYVDGRWTRADELGVGDTLLTVAAAGAAASSFSVVPERVQRIESLGHTDTTYNFEVERLHNYFAGDVLVHNLKKDTSP